MAELVSEVDEAVVDAEETEETTENVKKEDQKSIYELLEEDINNSDLPLQEKNERLSRLIRARSKQANILIAGATGSGKSSTINALFNMDIAKVGVGVDPETDCITKYELG